MEKETLVIELEVTINMDELQIQLHNLENWIEWENINMIESSLFKNTKTWITIYSQFDWLPELRHSIAFIPKYQVYPSPESMLLKSNRIRLMYYCIKKLNIVPPTIITAK